MNEINIREVYYLTAKERFPELAEDFLSRLETLSIRTISNSFAQVIEAARLKARLPIAYADAFAAATAIRMNAVIVTGDPEFRRIEHLVTINWL